MCLRIVCKVFFDHMLLLLIVRLNTLYSNVEKYVQLDKKWKND